MIQTNLHMLLAKNRMTQKQLAEATNINKNTISRYYNNTFEKFDKEHMDILCKTLDCNIQDIFFYIPDEDVIPLKLPNVFKD